MKDIFLKYIPWAWIGFGGALYFVIGWLGYALAKSNPADVFELFGVFMVVLFLAGATLVLAARNRAKAEQILKSSEARYRSLVAASAQVIWTIDGRGIIAEDSPTWRGFTGQSREAFFGNGWMAMIHPDDQARIARKWDLSSTEKVPCEAEFRLRTGDGSYRDVFIRVVPVLDASGEVVEWIGALRDITEKKQAERQNDILLNLTRGLNGATSPREAGRIIVGLANRLFGWDACAVYHWDRENDAMFTVINMDTINGEVKDVSPLYKGNTPSELARQILRDGTRLVLRDKPEFFSGGEAFGDKSRPSLSLMFAPIRHGERVLGFLSIQSYSPYAYSEEHLALLQVLADFCGGALERIHATEALRKAEEQLRGYAQDLERRVAERTDELKETISSLESFCYTIAHDLRAPLRGVQGFAAVLLEDYGSSLDANGKDLCRRLNDSASRMDALIQDLLTYGHLAHKELPLGAVNLDRLVDRIVEQIAGGARNDLATRLEVRHPFPTVVGNEVVLEQVIGNLISNARKFVREDLTPQIKIWAECDGANVRLFVQDNGIGIAPEHQERIFKVFERLHTASEYPGTGIGLAIVRKGVERMGGSVGLESNLGQGSVFRIDLPKAHQSTQD